MRKSVIKEILIFIFILFLSYVQFFFYDKELINYDNIWNFHFIQKIHLGLIPYKEFNMVIPPYFHFLGVLFFRILGANFYTFFLYGAIIKTLIIELGRIIVKAITKNNWADLFITFLLLSIVSNSPNYNELSLLLVTSIIYIEETFLLNKSKVGKTLYHFILIGFLLGLIIGTKHNIGFFISLSYFVYLLIIKKPFSSKENFILALKDYIAILGGIIIAILPLIIYLALNNALMDFIYYCFTGIFLFAEKNSRFNLQGLGLLVFPLFLLIITLLTNYKKQFQLNAFLIAFSLASLTIAYPLANNAHIKLALIIPIISILIETCFLIKERPLTYRKRYIKLGIICTSLTIFGFLFVTELKLCSSDFQEQIGRKIEAPYSVYEAFYSLNTAHFNQIKKVNDYMNQMQKEGYLPCILSLDASIYEIPFNKSNGVYDLLLNGNLGFRGISSIINELDKIKKPLFLKSTFQPKWQESEELEDYITNNYTQIEQFDDMRVFVKS